MTSSPDPAPDARRFPIFVDDTGRRRRWLRLTGWLIGALASAYLALFALSLISSPGLLPLSLPGVGRLLPNAAAPDIPAAGGGHKRPGDVVSPTPSPTAPTTTLPAVAPTPARSSQAARQTARPKPSRTDGRSSAPSAVPTVTPTRRGSPTSHPTPRASGRPTARPTHTPHSANRPSPATT